MGRHPAIDWSTTMADKSVADKSMADKNIAEKDAEKQPSRDHKRLMNETARPPESSRELNDASQRVEVISRNGKHSPQKRIIVPD